MDVHINPMEVGGRIKTLRTERGFTQKDLAALLHVSDKAVSKWERGECFPDLTLLPELSRLFGVSVDRLLGLEAEGLASESDGGKWAKNGLPTGQVGRKLRKTACRAAILALLGPVLSCLLEILLGSGFSLPMFLHFPTPILLLLACFFYSYQEKKLLSACALPEKEKRENRCFLYLFSAEMLLLFVILAVPLGSGNIRSQWPYGLSSQLFLLTLCILGALQIWGFFISPSGQRWFPGKLWAGGLATLLVGAALMIVHLCHLPEVEAIAQAEFTDPVYINSEVAAAMTRNAVESFLEQLTQQQNQLLLLLLGLVLLYHLLLLLDKELRRQPWRIALMLLASILALLLCSQCISLLLGGQSGTTGKMMYALYWQQGPAFAVLLLWSCGLLASFQRKQSPAEEIPAKNPLFEAEDV